MVRLWSEEVGNAKSVIEPLVMRIDSGVDVQVDGGEGFRNDTVEVRLKKGAREARCVVTFEAWEQARNHPQEMEEAFRTILGDMGTGRPVPAYLFTTRGLATESREKDPELLRDLAAGTEADVLADRLPRRSKE